MQQGNVLLKEETVGCVGSEEMQGLRAPLLPGRQNKSKTRYFFLSILLLKRKETGRVEPCQNDLLKVILHVSFQPEKAKRVLSYDKAAFLSLFLFQGSISKQ